MRVCWVQDVIRLAIFCLMCTLSIQRAYSQKQHPGTHAHLHHSFASIVKRAAPAVVNIYMQSQQRAVSPFIDDQNFLEFFSRRFGVPQNRKQNSLGSGVIINQKGLLITNAHVIKSRDRAEIRVLLADRREFSARVVVSDERTDIAILQIEGNDQTFPFLNFENSDDIEVGDIVLAIGNPFGVGQTVTSGIVSALARSGLGKSDEQVFIQTDAAINPGNSGGALVDMNARLIGINTAIYSRTGASHGIGFAIPSNLVRLYVNSAVTGQKVKRLWFGGELKTVTREIANDLGLRRISGAVVSKLYKNGPAANAGLLIGDVIVAVDGHEVADARAALYRLTTRGIGNIAVLSILRHKRLIKISFKVKAAPKLHHDDIRNFSGNHPLDGARIANLAPSIIDELKLDYSIDKGVVFISVLPRSIAASIGFRRGDVLLSIGDRKILNVNQLARDILKPRQLWSISIRRGQRVLKVEIPTLR
ncbi:MAG: Periplasmic serine endoprotease DegP [Hyphomicrobiaceae bacterium hypho_1]